MSFWWCGVVVYGCGVAVVLRHSSWKKAKDMQIHPMWFPAASITFRNFLSLVYVPLSPNLKVDMWNGGGVLKWPKLIDHLASRDGNELEQKHAACESRASFHWCLLGCFSFEKGSPCLYWGILCCMLQVMFRSCCICLFNRRHVSLYF